VTVSAATRQMLPHLALPETSLWFNLEVSATRYPNRAAVIFYDSVLTYSDLKRDAERLAGFLQAKCGVQRGDRVALQLHMINAAGFKVWPAEVEAQLYAHPAVKEVAIISKPDPRRGETVKAVVVLRDAARGKVTEEELTNWSRQNMAAYKVPRSWEFVNSLPKSASGKILWRVLQDLERLNASSGAASIMTQ
jgi:acyl-CoA synthetase (AMP-forming)/AMP-acid ligase II